MSKFLRDIDEDDADYDRIVKPIKSCVTSKFIKSSSEWSLYTNPWSVFTNHSQENSFCCFLQHFVHLKVTQLLIG